MAGTSPQAVLPQDPAELAGFGRLEVVARLVVEGFMIGQHKSPFKGSSIEFVEHRQYYPGDEIRHIDWRAYGKTGRYYIKEYEDETNLRCWLLLDSSGSMAWAGSTVSKFEYARYLVASLGYLLLSQRDATGLVTWDARVRDRIEPAASAGNLRRIMQTLDVTQPGGETSLAEVLASLLPTLKRRGLVVIVSDCFDDLDRLIAALKQYRHARHEVVLLRIVTPEEEEFPFSTPTQFRSLEQPRHRILVDPHRLRAHYLEKYGEFASGLAKRAAAAGIDLQTFRTDSPVQKSLGEFLVSRTGRGQRPSGGRSTGSG